MLAALARGAPSRCCAAGRRRCGALTRQTLATRVSRLRWRADTASSSRRSGRARRGCERGGQAAFAQPDVRHQPRGVDESDAAHVRSHRPRRPHAAGGACPPLRVSQLEARSRADTRALSVALLQAASVPLICADLFRHVLQDSGMWASSNSHMYLPPDAASSCDPGAAGDARCRAPLSAGGFGHSAPWTCDADLHLCACPEASIRCLSAVGWVFTILCTYAGFLCLFAGSCAARRASCCCCAHHHRSAQACCGAPTCRPSCDSCWRLDARVQRKTRPCRIRHDAPSRDAAPRKARFELRPD
jgi:hypothetical protein